MSSMVFKGVVLATALGLAASTSASADNNAPVESYQSVMSDGYQIKDVTLISADQGALVGGKSGQPQFVITLQKDQHTAVCYIGVNAWLNLALDVMAAADRCSVY